MNNTLRFVHISDIHFGQESAGEVIPYTDIRKQIIRDASELKEKQGTCDGILVAGDIAFKADRTEYESARAWLDDLAAAVGCKKHRVCVVPGNHDVHRSSIKITAETFHAQIRSNPHSAYDILAKLAAEKPADHPLLKPLTNYQVFAEQYGCSFDSAEQPLWRKSFCFPSGHGVEVVGMTSVLVCDKDDAPEKMVLGNSQYIIDQVDDREFFVMFHHPFCWLMDADEASDYLFSRARTIITGHKHRQRIHVHRSISGEEIVMLDSGATTPPRGETKYGYVYNWLEFALDHQASPPKMTVTVFPRCWSSTKTRFIADSSQTKDGESSSFVVECPRLLKCFPKETSASSDQAEKGNGAMTSSEEVDEVRLIFWRLSDKQRLQVLLDLDLIPENLVDASLSLWEERAALRRAEKQGKLKSIRDEVEKLTSKPAPPSTSGATSDSEGKQQ